MNHSDELGKTDGTVNRIEKIEPEKCKNGQDFDKALEKWAGQLDSALDNSKGANRMADIMVEKYSPEKLLEMRKEYDDSGAKFKDACFKHPEWSPEKRTEEIAKAKDKWESNHIGAHRIDMALKRRGYYPAANCEGTSGTKPDDGEGTTGSPAGNKLTPEMTAMLKRKGDGPDFGGRSFGTPKVDAADTPSSGPKWTDIRNTTDGTAINTDFAEEKAEEAEEKQKKAEKKAQPRVVAQWHGNLDDTSNQRQQQHG